MMKNEKRLIDVNELKFHKFCFVSANDAYRLGWNEAIDAVMENAPTVDAVEVVHGQWEEAGFITRGDYAECCSNCKSWVIEGGYPYCPICGAKMDL